MGPGVERELAIPGRSVSRTMECYTIPEAAQALGRSLSNFRRWLENDLIPAPILNDTTRHMSCYSVAELEVIADELNLHDRQFVNFCASHEATVLRISQRVHGLRDLEFGQVRRTR